MTRSRMTRTMIALTVVGALSAGALGAEAVYAGAQDGPAAPQERVRMRRGPGGPGGLWGGPMGLRLPLHQLDLTEAQREQVKGILESHRDELRATADKVQAAMKAQHDAVTAGQFDEGAVRERAAALAAVHADAAVLHARVYSDVFAVLTPEQQTKANELKAARAQRLNQMRDRIRERVKPRQGRPQA